MPPLLPQLSWPKPLLLLLLLAILPSPSVAHTVRVASGRLDLDTDEWRLMLRCDPSQMLINALELPDNNKEWIAPLWQGSDEVLAAGLQKVAQDFSAQSSLVVDGVAMDWDSLKLPDAASYREVMDPTRPPRLVNIFARGPLPKGAEALVLTLPQELGAMALSVHWGPRSMHLLLGAGLPSPPIGLSPAREVQAQQNVFARFTVLGFQHILPLGIDHILFVLGLFLLCLQLRPLLIQVSCFTLAHTITLALATFGVVRLPAQLVETLIAVSIVFIALENLVTSELKPWRPALVFLFGLLHGLGFARMLVDLGLPQGQALPALLAFNIGVELGQLTVIAAALLAVGWYRNSPNYRKRVTLPGSLAIALVASVWVLQRAFL